MRDAPAHKSLCSSCRDAVANKNDFFMHAPFEHIVVRFEVFFYQSFICHIDTTPCFGVDNIFLFDKPIVGINMILLVFLDLVLPTVRIGIPLMAILTSSPDQYSADVFYANDMLGHLRNFRTLGSYPYPGALDYLSISFRASFFPIPGRF